MHNLRMAELFRDCRFGTAKRQKEIGTAVTIYKHWLNFISTQGPEMMDISIDIYLAFPPYMSIPYFYIITTATVGILM